MTNIRRCVRSATLVMSLAVPVLLSAQADEVQVYQGGLANTGTLNVTLHNNYTPVGIKTNGFPGGVIPNKSFNGVSEFAYGVNTWFEAGLYLPLYTLDNATGFGLDGFKLRTLIAVPYGDERTFVYGLGFELSFNAKRWDAHRITSEFRPILGWHLKPVDVIFNPIFDTSYEGGLKSLDFAPSTRIAYNFNSTWAGALEEYADFGELRKLQTGNDASHQVYAVIDHAGKTWDVEVGGGVGVTNAADKFTVKLIVARDLHSRKE